MRRRYSLGHLILAVVVALSLKSLMIVVDAQATDCLLCLIGMETGKFT